MPDLTRRAALLGATGLLGGCETITDFFDGIFGERKVPLRGERRPVLSLERPLGVDEGPPTPVTLPPPQDLPAWPQVGGNIGHSPGHPSLGPQLGVAWRSSIGTGSAYRRRLIAPPIMAGDQVIGVDTGGMVSAVDVAQGRRRWRLDTRPEEEREGALGAGCAAEGNTLYIATSLAEMLAVNLADGKVKWRVSLPAPSRGAPTVAEGRIFVPTLDNQLIALKAEDGDKLWTWRGQPASTLALGLPAPAVSGDNVVCGLGSGELAAVRASDGRVLWTESLGTPRGGGGIADISAISALPVIDRGRVFATSLGGLTIALDLRSGRRLWERNVGSSETPWSVGDWLFLVSTEQQLLCLSRDDGRVRWLQPLGRFRDETRRRDPITWGPPVLAGGRIIVCGSNAQLLEIDPTSGEITRRLRLPAGALLQPALAAGTMYLLTEDAELVALAG